MVDLEPSIVDIDCQQRLGRNLDQRGVQGAPVPTLIRPVTAPTHLVQLVVILDIVNANL